MHRRRRARRSPADGAARIAVAPVVPGWIRTFDDPELTRARRGCRRRAIPTCRPPPRAWKPRATRCAVAASSLYPRIAMKGLGERQGRETRRRPRASASIRRTLAALGRRRSGGSGRHAAASNQSSQRWVYGLGIGAAWEADVWGRIRSKKGRRAGRERCARGRLRIRPAVARRRGGARLFLDHRSRAAGCECAGNARALRGIFEADRRAQGAGLTRATSTSRRSSRAPPARRTRSSPRRARGRRPSAPSKSSPATIPRARLGVRRSFPAPAATPCPPVCPRRSSNAGPMSSPPSAASPPPFIA